VRRLRVAGRISGGDADSIFILLSGVIYLLPFLADGFLDRHLVPAIPLLALGLAGVCCSLPRSYLQQSVTLRLSGVALLAALALFAIGSTRDYVEWNRVRWEALGSLVEDCRVDAAKIDGGFEFNGLHFFDPDFEVVPNKSWWWVQDDVYRLGFGPMEGYKVINEYSYINWIPPRVGKVLVLKRDALPRQERDMHPEPLSTHRPGHGRALPWSDTFEMAFFTASGSPR
jgi:hypothetical protein